MSLQRHFYAYNFIIMYEFSEHRKDFGPEDGDSEEGRTSVRFHAPLHGIQKGLHLQNEVRQRPSRRRKVRRQFLDF